MNNDKRKPQPCGASRSEILDYAEEVARDWGLIPGGDLEGLVKELSGKIENSPHSDEKRKASIEVQKGGRFVITLFRSLFPLPLHKRVLIAHEFGHLALHSCYGEKAIGASCAVENEDDLAEIEASCFADGFLVPTGSLLEVRKDFSNDIVGLTAYFMVPESVIRRRLVDVGK
ncbi:MAG: ImmA/IrrE family metallo-endopeptidase [Treponema sp.]|nr:ImmA/IrrE family metallo-endopeptidase [Treponema sp.]